MNSFFHSHEPYEDITLNDVWPPFHPPMYPTDGEFDSNTRLTPTNLVESDPSELMYPFVIYLPLDSSSYVAS